MLQSMTGYGKADALYNGKKIVVEIRSLNSKNLDLTARIAPLYREKEMELRQMVGAVVLRGKAELSILAEKGKVQQMPAISSEAVANYKEQIEALAVAQGLDTPSNLLELILRLPEVTQTQTIEELSEEEWNVVKACVEEALVHFVDFRNQEGEALAKKFVEKVDNIERLMHEIVPFEQARVDRIRKQLEERLAELTGIDYDKNRLEQELIYYIEKLDISEEKQRLSNHLNYFRETLNGPAGQGKKLGFIAQEMGREINTTGSKSNQAEMQNIVVKMKDELEQIKEQVLNAL
ncbi:MAG: YicC family protein [Bacteroidales bacterium]|nr:YicC family protein [Bacteroidales bacterium]